MEKAHDGVPVREFPVPEGVSYARVDPATGMLAGEGDGAAYMQAFPAGSEPTERAGAGALSEGDERALMRMDF